MNRAPTGTPAAATRQTPLGEPISADSASLQSQDPLKWHLRYWLDLGVIGVLKSQNKVLMGVRIDMEHEKIADEKFRAHLRKEWQPYHEKNKDSFRQYWDQKANWKTGAKPFLEDINRMMAYKEHKMSLELDSPHRSMTNCSQNGRDDEAKNVCTMINTIGYDMSRRENAEIDRLRNITDCVIYNQGR